MVDENGLPLDDESCTDSDALTPPRSPSKSPNKGKSRRKYSMKSNVMSLKRTKSNFDFNL